MNQHPTRIWRRALLVGALFVVSCSTDQCDCNGWEQRDFPSNRLDVTIPSAGQARVTSHGLDYVESQVPYLMDQFLTDGLSFCIPRDTSGNPELCVASTCDSGAAGCQVDLTLDDQSITPQPSDTLEVNLTIGDINERLNFDYGTFLGDVNCYVQLFKDGSSESTAAEVIGSIPITIGVDGSSPTKELTIDVGTVAVDLDDLDFKIHGRGNVGDTVACGGASLVRGLFRGMIEREVTKILNDTVSGIADEQLCRRCGSGFEACDVGTCQAGVCRYGSGQCVPRPLGVEGRLNVGGLLADFTKEPGADLEVLGKAGDHAIVDTGVSIGLRAGVDTRAVSECAPIDPTRRPSSRVVPISPIVNANTKPNDGEFHLGVGIHKSVIEHALWSVWASGVSCLEVSSDDVELLSATTFSIVAPSIKDFAAGGAHAILAVVPQKAPEVALGANRITPMGATYTIAEPLLTIVWKDFDFHVFVQAQDRLMRMFSLRVDLTVPLAISPDGGGSLIPVLGDIEGAIQNIRVRRTELLAEDDQRIIDLVPTLIGFAAPQLVGALPEVVELPTFLGFELDLEEGDIAGVDKNEFLAVFASLKRSTQAIEAMNPQAFVLAHRVDYSRKTPSGLVRPSLEVDVATLPSPVVNWEDVEFSYRVDGGIWSMFTSKRTLTIDDPILVVPGEHRVSVRARAKGVMGTTSAPMGFDVHIEAPHLVTMTDAILPATPLSAFTVPNTVQEPVMTDVEPQLPAAPPEPTGGCNAAGATPWALPFLLIMGLFRRRRWLAIAAVALLMMGCKGDLQTNAASQCFGEGCRVNQGCEADADCSGICPTGNSGICEDNQCKCVAACGDGCGEGEFCCLSSSSCETLMPSCDSVCEPGFEARVVGEPNRSTCNVDGACECVLMPPVPTGVHGEFLDLASDGTLTVVAAYNRTYADLMIGQVAADDSIAWEFVDGVPETGDIVGDPSFRDGIADRGPKVGTHLAVAVEAGQVHVVYRNDDDDTLLYRTGTPGAWGAPLTLASGDAAKWPSIAAISGTVHVVYSAADETGGTSALKHVQVANGVASAQPSVVEGAYDTATDRGFERRIGMFADLTATPTQGLFVVFYDGETKRVGRTVYARSWGEIEYLASGTGPHASAVIDDQGQQHVVFMVGTGLRYSLFGSGGPVTSLVAGTVRDQVDEYYSGPIGADARIGLSGGAVTVTYHDPFDLSLNVASGDGTSGTWDTQTLRPSGQATGLHSRVCRGCEKIADYVVNREAEPWGFVRIQNR